MQNNKLKILVVDDSDFFGEAIKRILDDYECEILFCNDGLTGIKYAVEENPSLIFMQLMMPKFNGIDMLKVLDTLQISQKIPVVVMLNEVHSKLLPEVAKYKIKKAIYKPFSRKQILDIIIELIGEKILLHIKTESSENKYPGKTSTANKNNLIKTIAIKLFIKSIPETKRDILYSFSRKDKKDLTQVFEKLNESGLEFGYPKLSYLTEFLIKKVNKAEIISDWDEIEEYINTLFDILNLIISERS